ncbi:MAG: BACON domain-containing protein [Bryobacteraceae bacterium]
MHITSTLNRSIIPMVLSLFAISGVHAQTSIVVNSTGIQLTSQPGNSSPVSQAITVTSNGAAFGFQVTTSVTTPSGGSWLSVDRLSGTTPSAVLVSANAAALGAGTYSGLVQITAAGTSNSPVSVPVTFVVGGGSQLVSAPASLTFNYQLGGTFPPAQTMSVTSGGQPVSFTAAPLLVSGAGWLELSPTSGTTPANVTVSSPAAILSGAAPGVYTGFVVLTPTSGGGTAVQVPVTLNVTGTPQFTAIPSAISFNYQTGQANPPQQTINLGLLGGVGNFTITLGTSQGGNWLVVTPLSGVTPTTLTVGVQQPSSLPPGVYNGTIVVASPSGVGTSLTIRVTLTVSNSPLLSLAPNALQFTYQVGGTLPASQTITPSSTSSAISYSVVPQATGGNWLIVNPAAGATPNPISVGVDPSGLAAGTYTGTVTVTGTGTGNAAQSVPVTLTITNNPILTVSTASLTFNYQRGRDIPGAQVVNVNSTGSPFNYTITAETISGAGYLSVNSAGGTTPGSFTVSMVPSVLMTGLQGIYSARITLTAPGAANSPLVIPLTLVLSETTLVNVSQTSLSFNFQGSGALPPPQFLSLTSSGDPVNLTVSSSSTGGWLTVGPSTASTPANVTVQVTPLGLLPGTYNGTITVVATIPNVGATLNSPITVPVTLTISAGTLAATPASLTFLQAQGGNAPPPQTINVTSNGPALNYSATATTSIGSWLSVSPASAATPGAVTVSVNGSGLAAGTYSGTVTLTAAGASNSPLNIPVTLTVGPQQTLTVSPTTLTFSHQLGAAAPATQTVSLSSSGTALNFTTAATTASGGAWLTATPASGTTGATVTIGVNPAGLAAGTYTGTVTITAPGASNSPQTVSVTLTIAAVATPSPSAVGNAASFAPGPIAPGEVVSIVGTNLGPATPAFFRLNSVGTIDPTLSDTQVLFDSLPGTVLYTSQSQINVVVPYGIFGRLSVRMTVAYRGQVSSSIELRVADAAPAIFAVAGSNQGAIVNQNNTVNTANNPAAKGSVITVYLTGEGQTNPGGQDGRVTPIDGTQLKRPLLPVTATIGGIPAVVEYAGSSPGIVSGVMQANLRIAENVPSGNQPVVITVGANASPSTVTVAVQ